MARKKEATVTLDRVMQSANKNYGAGTIFHGSSLLKDPPRIPFGVFAVDFAIGGGLPLHGTSCLWGGESSGKSSLCLSCMAAAGNLCWRCFNHIELCSCSLSPLRMKAAWEDVEGTLDRGWASDVGNDPDKYVVVLAESGEQYVNIADSILKADDLGLLVIDSLGMLTPLAELEGDAEDQFIGLQSRLITRMIRKLKTRLILERKRGHPCLVLFTNQMRSKIGVMFGSPETMSGGHSARHDFSLLLRCSQKALQKNERDRYLAASREKQCAVRHAFSIRKQKVMTLAGTGEYVRVIEPIPDLELSAGDVDDTHTLMKYAREYGVVKKEGKDWMYFSHKARVLDNVSNLWKTNPVQKFRASAEVLKRAKKQVRG